MNINDHLPFLKLKKKMFLKVPYSIIIYMSEWLEVLIVLSKTSHLKDKDRTTEHDQIISMATLSDSMYSAPYLKTTFLFYTIMSPYWTLYYYMSESWSS